MSEELEAAARLAVEEALGAGGDEAEAWCEDAVERSVRVYDGTVESITEAGSNINQINRCNEKFDPANP